MVDFLPAQWMRAGLAGANTLTPPNSSRHLPSLLDACGGYSVPSASACSARSAGTTTAASWIVRENMA